MNGNVAPIVVTGIILALMFIAGAHLVDDLPTKAEMEKADQMVNDPYEDKPWWSVGMMPVLLTTGPVLFILYIAGGLMSWWKVFGVPVSMRP